MASIGPQLPPHLQPKRKRTPEDDSAVESTSPPAKISRRYNNDEISLKDDSDDDGYGPSAPAPTVTTNGPTIGPSIGPSLPSGYAQPQAQPPSAPEPKRSIGPSLPPPSAATNQDEIALDGDSDSDDNTGPTLPPTSSSTTTVAAAVKGPAAPPPGARRAVIGPAPPPADLAERPTTGPNSDPESSDDDDDWGPALPGAAPANARATNTYGPSFPPAAQEAQQPQPAKRDDWMIAPPTSSGYRAPDPTKLKNRKFASGPRTATDKPGGISSIWTETPEEKRRRLANAVLGREDPSSSSAAPTTADTGISSIGTKRTAADEARIRAYTEQTRGRSLVEQHQAANAKSKQSRPSGAGSQYGKKATDDAAADDDEDDPSKRTFDREKDMAIGGRLSNTQRRDMLNKAATFGNRFQKGSFL